MTKSNLPLAKGAHPLGVMDNPYLLLTLASLFWGGNIIAGKFAIGEIDPFSLSTLRWLVAFLMIAPFAWPSLYAEWRQIRKGLGWLALYGALGFAGFNALLYAAARETAAVNIAMIQAAIPVLVMAGNFVVFKVRASPLHIVGVALAIYGVIHVATHGSPLLLIGLNLNTGDAMMLGASLLYAIYSLTLRYKPAIGWMSFIAMTSLFAALASMLYQMVLSTGLETIVPTVLAMSPRGWLVLAYVAILPSIVSQLTYARGVELIGPNRASLFINLIPVFGALLAVVLLGETLFGFHLFAALFIMAGIALSEYAARRKP